MKDSDEIKIRRAYDRTEAAEILKKKNSSGTAEGKRTDLLGHKLNDGPMSSIT